jgi:hypothetical protein
LGTKEAKPFSLSPRTAAALLGLRTAAHEAGHRRCALQRT